VREKTWTRALVTGASSGIGDRIARRLAGAGTALVVVARDEVRLRRLAEELQVDVEVLAADLAEPLQRALVAERLRALDRPVDLLVNNAGFGFIGRFWELDPDGEQSVVDVNVSAVLQLTHAALEGMVARGHGSILNISSLGSLQPAPTSATYVATKALVTNFTESLHEELRGTGVTATAVLPGFTRTEFQQRANATIHGPGFVWQDADAVAAEALAAAAAGRAVRITGGLNRVAAALMGPLPRVVKRRGAGFVTSRFEPPAT